MLKKPSPQVVRNGLAHPDPVRATKYVIGPLIVGLLGMILLPPAVLWCITRVVTLPMDGDFLCEHSCLLSVSGIANAVSLLVLHVYPGIFTIAALAHAAYAMRRVMDSWSQTIRDKEFVVEMRLRNLEPAPERKARSGTR